MATEDGLLIVVSKEHFNPTGKLKAREYQFNLSVLEMKGNDDESERTISPICATTE